MNTDLSELERGGSEALAALEMLGMLQSPNERGGVYSDPVREKAAFYSAVLRRLIERNNALMGEIDRLRDLARQALGETP